MWQIAFSHFGKRGRRHISPFIQATRVEVTTAALVHRAPCQSPGQVSQAAIVENKEVGVALAFIYEQQLRREPDRCSGPRRRRIPRRSKPVPSIPNVVGSGTVVDTTMLSMFVDVPRMFVVIINLSMLSLETPLSSVSKTAVFSSWVPVTLKTGALSNVR
jgi:hypothetical protein